MAASFAVENEKDVAIRSQMTKFGWLEGKGLGKKEQGRKEAIKVSLKNNKNGLGLDPSEQFVFHWWDHVFNKVASSIKIEESGDEVTISKHKGDQLAGPVSSKRPSNAAKGKELLYGRFVRSETTVVGGELVGTADKHSESSDESDGEKDFSNADTLEKAFRISGGMTAHKAARHGHQLNGKLKRLQDQEGASSDHNSSSSNLAKEDCVVKQKKNKRKSKDKKLISTEDIAGELQNDVQDELSKECMVDRLLLKKKKPSENVNEHVCTESSDRKPSSKIGKDVDSSKRKRKGKSEKDALCLKGSVDTECGTVVDKGTKKKKKKRKRNSSCCEEMNKDLADIAANQVEGQKRKKKKKEKRKKTEC